MSACLPPSGFDIFDKFAESEKIRGLEEYEEIAEEATAGVIRQVLARPDVQLTAKQYYHYQQAAKGAVEKCSTCPKWIPLNDTYCPVCKIEYR